MLNWPVSLAALVGAAVISGVGSAVTRRLSLRRGFVDLPGGHKGHDAPVALGGGVPVTLAVILPILAGVAGANLWDWCSTHVQAPASAAGWLTDTLHAHVDGIVAKSGMALGIVLAAAGICAIGLWDDARPLRPIVKLTAQIVIAVGLVVGCDLRLVTHLGYFASAGLSVAWILTLTNSLNFLDNMDGLAAGVTMISAAVFALAAGMSGQLFVPTCCWLLVGAVAGFLPFNFHPASIYLGDAGSMVLGLLLAVFTILTTYVDPTAGPKPLGLAAPLVVMAVPLYDTASVILARWRAGDPIWRGDRRHFSHRLVRRGMGVRRAVLLIWLATLTTAMPALLLPTAGWALAVGVLVQTLLVVALVALMESAGAHGRTTG